VTQTDIKFTHKPRVLSIVIGHRPTTCINSAYVTRILKQLQCFGKWQGRLRPNASSNKAKTEFLPRIGLWMQFWGVIIVPKVEYEICNTVLNVSLLN